MALGDDLWRLCHVLRHQGVGYGEYVDQLANILSIRLLAPQSSAAATAWRDIKAGGPSTIARYRKWLRQLASEPGTVGDVFKSSECLFVDDVALIHVVQAIERASTDDNASQIVATTFEDLLRRAASEGKKGAGQYFTPEFVARAMVATLRPAPTEPAAREFHVTDPAAGVGGFLIAAHQWASQHSPATAHQVQYQATEIATQPARLARINFLSHGMTGEVRTADSLSASTAHPKADVVITNPPFGLQGGAKAAISSSLAFPTSAKQLAFLQIVASQLKRQGRAAVLLPDSALESNRPKGLWEFLTETLSLHTVLRLPLKTFTPYAPSIRTSVVYLQSGRRTTSTWVFDTRHAPIPLDEFSREALVADFVTAYGERPQGDSSRNPATYNSGTWSRHHPSDVFGTVFSAPSLPVQHRTRVDPAEHLKAAIGELESASDRLHVLLNGLQ